MRQPKRLPPQSGTAFVLRRGELLRIIDPLGQQVADLTAFGTTEPREWLSSGRTFDYNENIYVTTGTALYSNRSNRMFTIGEDRVGKHDFLLMPCSEEMFKLLGRCSGHHPNCLENLAGALRSFDITINQIPTTFNVFMSVQLSSSGRISVTAPQSQPGDFLDLRAERDVIVALTACSSEYSNNGVCKPIDFDVLG